MEHQRKRRLQYPPWLTIEQFMEMMQIGSRNTVTEMLARGEIPFVKIGRYYRIDRDGVYLAARQSLKGEQLNEMSAMRQRVGA